MKHFYITTPLYYVNDSPHLGNSYSTIMADIFSRYHKLFGDQTLFLTGTDEHGQKCQQAAEKKGLTPQEHCDEMMQKFKEAWADLDIQYDIFFRTTDSFHRIAVQKVLQELFDRGEIYADTYEGWYCVSDEIFYTEKELVDGKSPTGREVQRITEKNYFFRMSRYQQKLIQYINEHPEYIQPESRRNEVLGFLRQPLSDLCISRPKSRLNWGIEIPFDHDYVTYVWFDALLNYATGVGLYQEQRKAEFDQWWVKGSPVHLIGKDILTTHAVYWSTMLLALGVSLPKTIFAHGWILNRDQNKMSKSKGDVVNPLSLKNRVGVDAFRYFLARDIHFGNDAPFSEELLINRVNTDLANNLGNLLSRVAQLIEKFFSGKIPCHSNLHNSNLGQDQDFRTQQLKEVALRLADEVVRDIEGFSLSFALEKIFHLLSETNKYLEEKAPWKLAKTDLVTAGHVLYVTLECLRISAVLLRPVMPQKMTELLNRLGQDHLKNSDVSMAKKWGVIPDQTSILKGEPLFPRLE